MKMPQRNKVLEALKERRVRVVDTQERRNEEDKKLLDTLRDGRNIHVSEGATRPFTPPLPYLLSNDW